MFALLSRKVTYKRKKLVEQLNRILLLCTMSVQDVGDYSPPHHPVPCSP